MPELTGNNVTFNLTSMTPDALRDLTMSISLLKAGTVNIKYTYSNMTGVTKAPFEVPAAIIDVNRTDLHPTGKLSDFVTMTQADATSPLSIDIKNGNTTSVFTLNGFLLGENINVMNTTAKTYVVAPNDGSYKGVMGLSEQVSSDLFLPDGVFSLWSRD